MGQFTSILLILIAAFSHETRCENAILGGEQFEFVGGSSHQHYSNVDGVVSHDGGYKSYEQKPDGSCVMKVVEVKDGVSSTQEVPIDCEEAKKEVDRIAEQTRQNIERKREEMNFKHEKMMREHYENLVELQRKINDMQASFPKFK